MKRNEHLENVKMLFADQGILIITYCNEFILLSQEEKLHYEALWKARRHEYRSGTGLKTSKNLNCTTKCHLHITKTWDRTLWITWKEYAKQHKKEIKNYPKMYKLHKECEHWGSWNIGRPSREIVSSSSKGRDCTGRERKRRKILNPRRQRPEKLQKSYAPHGGNRKRRGEQKHGKSESSSNKRCQKKSSMKKRSAKKTPNDKENSLTWSKSFSIKMWI